MRTNLFDELEKELDLVASKLEATVFKNVYGFPALETPYKTRGDSTDLLVRLSHEILDYETPTYDQPDPEDYDDEGDASVLWVCVQFTATGLGEDIQEALTDLLASKLKEAGLTPFKDEDAFCECATRVEYKDGTVEIKLYVNPDFPDGAWSNHVLG